jgi:alpha-L-rhamnosidase
VHLEYRGKPLASNTRYFWQVEIWDRFGKRFRSEPSTFATALMAEGDWQAKWIGANRAPEPKPGKGFIMEAKEESDLEIPVAHDGQSVLLRTEFALDKLVESARVFVTGLGFYELMLNDKRVGENVLAPAKTPYHKHILYDTYDVTSLLRQGDNAIGLHLGNGWYDPYKKWWQEYRMQWFGYKKALVQLHVTYTDGTERIIVSDEAWKTTRGPVLYNCVYDGEVYDANAEKPGWSLPGYDDSAWDRAAIMDRPRAKLLSHVMPPIRINEVRSPVKVTEPKPAMKVYDLGQNFTGWVRVAMKGAKGTKVTLRFSEELHDDGTLDFTCNEKAKATVEYVMKGGGLEVYEPRFTYFGFQYVAITADPELSAIERVEGCVTFSANDHIGEFACSHSLINKMHHATVWSQRSNMLSYPMDCPQRDERLGWFGDAQVTAEEAMFNFDMALFYKNWLAGIRANQDAASGDIPIISPRPYVKD